MDNLTSAMKGLHRALKFLVVALVFVLLTQFLRFSGLVGPKWALVTALGVGVLSGILWLIVRFRRRIAKVVRRLWPFVLKRTAMKVIEEQKIAERERVVFMKYDELFKELPAYEFSRHSNMDVLGAALISPHGHPVAIKKFNYSRKMITGDQVHVTI